MITIELAARLRESLLPSRLPLLLEWAQEHLVIPDGPRRGELFDPDVQPFSRIFLSAVDSGQYERIVATGPTQTGKTLICYVLPVLYHLFAVGETVVAGLPTIDMADDKWSQDFLPVIEASPTLQRLLPTIGPGSRSGKVNTKVRFRNGATLRFMSGGGSDKTRAGFTARVLAVTEVDGLDQSSETSVEADKIKQLEARQRAFLKTGIRTYLECTVSTTTGRIWQEYLEGTQSRIARPCPHCGKWVTPEREHLLGWQDTENELDARQNATWSCPSCAAPWSEQERYAANLRGVLVHRGQEITSDGEVTGPAPPTRSLGFRWTAIDNHFAAAGDVAADEWAATREHDAENAEKELRQFVHCIPHDPPEVDLQPLDPDAVLQRQTALKRGVLPAGCIGVTIGIDTGKRLLHWTAIAWLASGRGFVIEYGSQTVLSDKLGTQQGLSSALRTLKTYFDRGWQSLDGQRLFPSQVWIDSGYHEHQSAVYAFCGEVSKGLQSGASCYRPSKGYGEGQRLTGRYFAPKKKTTDVRLIANQYHLTWVPRARVMLVHVSSDHWKSALHQKLALPLDAETSLSLYETADAAEHREFVDHLTAERQIEKLNSARIPVITWERIRRQNHFLDAAYAAVAAGDLLLTFMKAKKPLRSLRDLARQNMKGGS